jgi:2-dehydro-3-deoxygluconokinase
MSNNKILCFGELLLRISPPVDGQWLYQNTMQVYLGGAELNVASALTSWHLPVAYFTALPDNYLSRDILEYADKKNIDTSRVYFSGKRIGNYYLQQGKDVKSDSIIYDREGSAFAALRSGSIDWNSILENVNWLHLSAISPALSLQLAEVCIELVKTAASKNITVSIDLNYRAKLWKYTSSPVNIMDAILPYCNVVMGNIWSANTLLGIPVDENIHTKKSHEAYLAHARTTSIAIQNKYPSCTHVANTFRFDNETGGVNYFTSLFCYDKQYNSKQYNCSAVKDKIGSGDCFMSGLIYGLYNQFPGQQVIDFATAAAFGKLQETGDATKQTIEDVLQLV